MNEFGKIRAEVNARIVRDTARFAYRKVTDNDPFGIDDYVNEFVARTGRGDGRKFKFRVLMNRDTRDRLNEAYSRRVSMFNRGEEEPARKTDIRIITSMTGSAVTVTENTALEDNVIRNRSNQNTEDMKKLKTGKERMFATADAFSASTLTVLTKKSPVYIGDENPYVSEGGEASRYEITGAMALAMTEVTDRIGLGDGKRPAKLPRALTDTVIDMISDRRAETARRETGVPPMENNVETPVIFNDDNRKPN